MTEQALNDIISTCSIRTLAGRSCRDCKYDGLCPDWVRAEKPDSALVTERGRYRDKTNTNEEVKRWVSRNLTRQT